MRRWPVFAAVALVSGTLSADASVPGPDSFRCQVAAFSPNVAKDRTGLCVTLDYRAGTVNPDGNATAYLTTDGGRTWQKRRSDGLRPVLSALLRQVVFSPTYADDGAIYLHALGRGLLRTTDGGDSWLPIAPAADSSYAYTAFTPTALAAPAGTATLPGIAAALEQPAFLSPPLQVPVAGAPGFDLQFLSARSQTFVVSLESDTGVVGGNALTRLYSCDAALACVTRLHDFPTGHQWRNGWLAADFDASGHIYAITEDANSQQYAWRSTDRGRTFSRWTSLDTFLRAITANGADVAIATRSGHRTIYARISHSAAPPRPGAPRPSAPGQQVLRSDDGGRSWRRSAFGRAFGQPGSRGTLPWDHDGIGVVGTGFFYAQPDGLLVTIAGKFPEYVGIFTSADGGRTWRRAKYS